MIVISDFHDQLPRSAHMFSMMIAHLNSAFNPILYGTFNPAFQRGYVQFLKILFNAKKRNIKKNTMERTIIVSTVESRL